MEEYPSPGSDGTSRNSYCRHWQIQEARRAFSQFGNGRYPAGLEWAPGPKRAHRRTAACRFSDLKIVQCIAQDNLDAAVRCVVELKAGRGRGKAGIDARRSLSTLGRMTVYGRFRPSPG